MSLRVLWIGAFTVGFAAAKNVKLTWTDCSGDKMHLKGVDLKFSANPLPTGDHITVIASGTLDEAVTDGEFSVSAKLGFLPVGGHKGSICGKTTFTDAVAGDVNVQGLDCTSTKAGAVSISLDVGTPASPPDATLKIRVQGTDQAKGGLFCVDVRAQVVDAESADGPNDANLIAYYNSRNGATWVAGHNEFLNGMTFNDASVLLGAKLTDIAEHLDDTFYDSLYAGLGEVPAEFDASTKWAGLVHPIRNQQRCGSCWAFSASEVMSDRVAIATGKPSPVLSAEDMVSCDKGDYGCQGGMLDSAWDYITNTGLLTDSCFPYGAGGGNAPACETKCADGSSFTRTKSTSAYAIKGVANIQKDLMTNGPIQVAFKVYNSFFSYKSGVYSKLSSETYPEGGHAVKFTGWGTEDGADYWLVANSWGTNWGLEGFFKIARGSDACGIETMGPPYAGHAAASSSVVV